VPQDTRPTLPSQVSPPEFALTAALPHAVRGVEVAAVPVLPGEGPDDPVVLGPGGAELGDQLGLDLLGVLELSRSTGRAGEIACVPVPLGGPENADLRLVVLVGVGAQRPDDLRRAGAALARETRDWSSVATSVAAVADDEGLAAFVVGAMLGSFGFHWRSRPPEHRPVGRVVLADLPDSLAPVVDRAVALGGAGWRSRLLATVPSNLKNPAWLAEQAEQIGRDAGLTVTVRDERWLADHGFGGIIGVGQASATPPRLIRLDYTPKKAGRRTPTVALVGKGITFDTGGLSIKPGEGMVTMKRDMTGGAVVMATLAALADVGCPVKVVGLVAAAENAVGGNALRPGDVIRHYGGRTTEVTNTDAEGRLVLADAMAYAVAALADVLREASVAAGEPLWRFPLTDAYEQKLSSTVADADNAPGGPGAIVAALFLQHFVDDRPWAHLDIASVGDAPEDSFEWTAGPSGFGARALLTWLGSDDPLAGIA